MEQPEQLKICVTQSDIKRGVPDNPHLCPIARAVRRLGRERITVEDTIKTRSKSFSLPPVASRFITNFDRNRQSVKPFTFVATRIADPWAEAR